MKIRIQKKEKTALILLTAIILNLSLASCANIGISPATIFFKQVLRGGYAERTVVISIDSSDLVNVSIFPRGDIVNWLNFSAYNFSVSKISPHQLKISVTPPADMPNGNYTGVLRVTTEGLGKGAEGQATGIVRASVDLAMITEVTDVESVACRASGFEVISAEKGEDIIFKMKVDNDGNIRLKPRLTIDIWDQDQISVIKKVEESGKEILPTTRGDIIIRVPTNDLEPGQYWVDVSALDCFAQQTLTFDVLEPGALKENGVLLGIIAKTWNEIGDTVPILINFKNTGEKEVSAQFRGKITSGDKIVQLLETEKLSVLPSETTNFSLYFTPNMPGKYIVSGRVFYNKKRTFESSAVMNVNPKKFGLKSALIYIVYAVLVIGAGLLVYKIRKERRVYFRKIKELGRLR
jgi:hypothetical protein